MKRDRGFALGWIYLIGAVALIGALYGVCKAINTAGYERGKAEVTAQWEEANRKQREADEKRIAGAGERLEAGNRSARVVYRTITKTVDRLVAADPGLALDCVGIDGLRVANDALAGALTDPAGADGAVPAADTAGRRDGSGAAPKDNRDRGGLLLVRPEASGTR